MKILPENSIPRRDGLRMLSHQDGRRVFHASSQKGIRLIPLSTRTDGDQPLSIRVLFRGKVNAHYHYRQEKSPFLGVEYVREGSILVRQGRRCYQIEPGDVFLLQPGADTEIMTGPEGECVKDSFPVEGPLLMPFLQTSGLKGRDCVLGIEWRRLESLLAELEELSLKNDLKSRISNSLLTYEILELLAYPDRSVEPDSRLATLVNFMRDSLDQPLNMKVLMKQSGLSEIVLNKAFRSVYGKTPHQLLIEWRMERAGKLIFSSPELSVKEISQRVGYPNPMNFSTAFRRFYGASPREYRRRMEKMNGFHGMLA